MEGARVARIAGHPGPQLRGGCAVRTAAAALAALASLGAAAAPVTVTVADNAGQPLADAAVAVHVAGETPAPPRPAEMAQRGRAFVPRVLVVQAGAAVSFPNFDPVHHHVYSFSPAKTFELKLYGNTPPPPVVFDQPGTVILGCNIHDRMSAYIHVVATARFGRTDDRGTTEVEVPPGRHRVEVWHPSLGAEQPPQAHTLQAGAAGAQWTIRLAPPGGTP